MPVVSEELDCPASYHYPTKIRNSHIISVVIPDILTYCVVHPLLHGLVALSSTDLRLLDQLQIDGRISNRELASELDCPNRHATTAFAPCTPIGSCSAPEPPRTPQSSADRCRR